jgi:putative hydrolase of the HAD superfamily
VPAHLHTERESQPVAVLLVDVAGTLLELREPPARTYHAAARRHGIPAELARIEPALHAALRALTPPTGPDLAQVRALERARWRAVVRAALGDTAADGPCFDDLFAHYATAQAWAPLPDAARALGHARARGVRLAIASNMDARLPGLLEQLGLAPLFSAIAIPATCGFAKPDRRIFEWVLGELGASPAQTLYLGDRMRDCVLAARAAGLRAYRLAPPGEPELDADALPGWAAVGALLA